MTKLILLVDDDTTIREFVSLVLQDEGFSVLTAAHGQEALRLVGKHEPALILLDMHMPLMDGWEFAQAYRQTSPPHAAIVVMTAAHAAHEAAADIQASDVLPKPFDIDDLIALAHRWTVG